MIIVHFGLFGISIKRRTLFGQGKHPVLAIRFLFFSAFIFTGTPISLFRQATEGLSHDPKWLIENQPSVRIARNKARSKAKAEMESQYSETLAHAWDRVGELESRRNELQNEVYSLQRSIKSIIDARNDQ